jgi:hypothetical protein
VKEKGEETEEKGIEAKRLKKCNRDKKKPIRVCED